MLLRIVIHKPSSHVVDVFGPKVRVRFRDQHAPVCVPLQCCNRLEIHAQLNAASDEAPPQGAMTKMRKIQPRGRVRQGLAHVAHLEQKIIGLLPGCFHQLLDQWTQLGEDWDLIPLVRLVAQHRDLAPRWGSAGWGGLV